MDPIFASIIYLWACIFFFPMIHDFFHEIGHGIFFFSECGVDHVRIVLGEYWYCPRNGDNTWTFCVTFGWFIKSLYRQSQAQTDGSCNSKLAAAGGGIMGIILSYVLITIVVSAIWKFYFKYPLKQSVLVGATFVVVPFKWLSQLEGLSFSTHAIVGFGVTVIRWDLINDFFYSFFPSRLIIWEFLEFGDGTWLWQISGYSMDTILSVSYAVFVMLLILYLGTAFLYARYLMGVRRGIRSKGQNGPLNA
ncbi:hypothetical protein BKA69DRAFT_1100103 [Paraphysoderma sedebokerense]|nr:hypothetical protein BKA69DRAFT_1100103 [Paraphysoderma sedebokerense]